MASCEGPVEFDCFGLNQFSVQVKHLNYALKALGLIMGSKNDKSLLRIRQIYEITGIEDVIFDENEEKIAGFCERVVSDIRSVYSFHKGSKPSKNKKGDTISVYYTCHRTARLRELRNDRARQAANDDATRRPPPKRTYPNIETIMLSPEDDECRGTLAIHIHLNTKTVTVAHNHVNHEYRELRRLTNKDREEIERIFEESYLSGYGAAGKLFTLGCFESASRNQISYKWCEMIRDISQLDANPIISLYKLATQKYDMYFTTRLVVTDEYFGIALIHKGASKHLTGTPELLMDSTYNIDSLGTELYTVIAPVDQVGCTVSYFFLFRDELSRRTYNDHASADTARMRKRKSPDVAKLRESKETQLRVAREYLSEIFRNLHMPIEDYGLTPKTKVVVWFLRCLKEFNYQPIFFGTDKDACQIAAIEKVFGCSVRLCMWHVKRSIDQHMRKYNYISDLDRTIYSNCAPDNDLISDTASVSCWSREAIQNGRTTCEQHVNCRRPCFCSDTLTTERQLVKKPDREAAGKLLYSHSLTTPGVPVYLRSLALEKPTKDDLIKAQTREMFKWCMENKATELWVYLWNNWYRPGMRENWMLLNLGPNGEVPLFCTTMLLESSHNRLKMMLGRSRNRRVDEVLYTICKLWMPRELVRLFALMHFDRGIAKKIVTSSWRSETVKQFTQMAKNSIRMYSRSIDEDGSLLKQAVEKFKTDPVNFLCGCEDYHNFRRRICPHILAFYDPSLFIPGTDIVNTKIQRLIQELQPASTVPYWRHEFLVVSRHLDLIPYGSEHVPRGQEYSWYRRWNGDFYELIRRLRPDRSNTLSDPDSVARDICSFEAIEMLFPEEFGNNDSESSQDTIDCSSEREGDSDLSLLSDRMRISPLLEEAFNVESFQGLNDVHSFIDPRGKDVAEWDFNTNRVIEEAVRFLIFIVETKERNDIVASTNLLNKAMPLFNLMKSVRYAHNKRKCITGEMYYATLEASLLQRLSLADLRAVCGDPIDIDLVLKLFSRTSLNP